MELNINSPVYFKDRYGIDDEVYKFCQRAYLFFKDNINLILFLLNCLPVYPLDIGRIVRLFSIKASRILSVITVILICILCVNMLIYNKSYSLIFVTIYLIIYSINYN